MADVEISYKGSQIASMSASGVKTLLTGDSFCEDDIVVSYTKPSAPTPVLQSKTVSPSTSQQTVSPDSGYDGLSSVTVNAMPSGTAGTPSAVKSSVSNHSVTVTPSVTNTTGYITGGTLTGTPASVSASELVSGTLSITDNGTGIDVTNYASVDVSVSGGGGGVTTVHFGEYSGAKVDGSGRITYLDGTGTQQTTTVISAGTAVDVDMISGSLLVYSDTFDPSLSGSFVLAYITGMTLVYNTSFTVASRTKMYYYVFQVD